MRITADTNLLVRVTVRDDEAQARLAMAALSSAATGLANSVSLDGLRAELKRVNIALWDIEDAIRTKDVRGEFDAGFVELARSVYRTNDERGRIKREINRLLGSDLVEEKQYAAHGAKPS